MPKVTSTRGTPSATYRVQLTPEFGFDDAAAIAGYLARLGITHLYCSPYLQAAKGSMHGYDVVDPTRVNAELGGDPALRRMVEALRAAGLSQVLDIVPNHMAIGDRANRWWWDVLENGRASAYAGFFDVDWNPPEAKLRNRVLMAILGDHYGRVLEAGQIAVAREGANFTVNYFEHVLPLAPPSLEPLLEGAARRCQSPELESLAAAFGRLPKSTEVGEDAMHERHRDTMVLKDRLADLFSESPDVAEAVDRQLKKVNSDPDELHEILERQNYRLAYWRTSVAELDYRRFFDVDTLVGVRQEVPEVFEASHELILGMVSEATIDGLRIDHPDGLRDPEGYLERLAARAPATWLVVEKILEPGERLPETWPVAGTTGYDFMNRLTGLLVDASAEAELTDLYRELTAEEADWEEVVRDRKHQVLREVLTADLARLTGILAGICERHRRYRDYTRFELTQALREVLACFPVYRTYIKPGQTISWQDLRYVVQAVEAAEDRRPDLDPDLFGFLESLLLLQMPESTEEGSPELELVLRFQQLSGPVMAKGVEDTAFYNYNRFVALNEVGGNPGSFGLSTQEFHSACREAQDLWSQSMLSSSTHDTKRSEDVRARLAVLSEMPQAWADAVKGWMKHNDRHRGADSPLDRNIEYLLYQVMVGAWPLTEERAVAYVQKASKEAKSHTSWLAPNAAYDDALVRFVEDLFADGEFQRMLEEFVAGLVTPGRVNSLVQTLLKLTAPGVPDTYQGTELWDLSLVDPDNRRPVDYSLRARLLGELDGMSVEDVMARSDEGLPKLFLINKSLELRRELPEAFGRESNYEALTAEGPAAGHVVAFTRWGVVATVVPRLTLGVGSWEGTTVSLAAGSWRNQLTGDRNAGGAVPVGDLLKRFPVALLRLES
ncbi:MAG TPA: malto-oligosyltrehalose synthase [Actinomycetota bacterium]|nr:malto-oligosyltrehalose synthase [Actinomycetota bacterium]